MGPGLYWTVSPEGDATTSGLRPRFPGRSNGRARSSFRRYTPLAPDGPELERQPREVAGDVHRHSPRARELTPQVVRLIELEVHEARVKRDLSRRNRHRVHRHARQLQVDEIANLLHGADLELRRKTMPQLLRGKIRTRAQHEDRAAVQRPIGHHRDADAELLRLDGYWNRALFQHRAERRP